MVHRGNLGSESNSKQSCPAHENNTREQGIQRVPELTLQQGNGCCALATVYLFLPFALDCQWLRETYFQNTTSKWACYKSLRGPSPASALSSHPPLSSGLLRAFPEGQAQLRYRQGTVEFAHKCVYCEVRITIPKGRTNSSLSLLCTTGQW